MEIGVGTLTPETVMISDNAVVFNATPVWSVKVNGSGVVSAASVVTLKVSLTPPTVSVALVVVAWELDAVSRTKAESPLLTVPDADVNEHAGQPLGMQFSAYSPPVMEMAVGALIPVTVMALETTVLFTATPVWPVKVNGFGVLSRA
jgi:hypothetical protein